jgi:hypothetical protein
MRAVWYQVSSWQIARLLRKPRVKRQRLDDLNGDGCDSHTAIRVIERLEDTGEELILMSEKTILPTVRSNSQRSRKPSISQPPTYAAQSDH